MISIDSARIPVEDLHFGSLSEKPVDIDDWEPEYKEDDEDRPQWWEAFKYTDPADVQWTLINENGRVRFVYINGTRYDSSGYWDASEDWETDNDGEEIPLDPREWDDLFDIEPSERQSEGPKMSCWYPCHVADEDEAVKLIDLPVCVVNVNGTAGLALTGGGMDLSWEIIEAYTRLGQLPPVHFAGDLPAMAGRGQSDRDRYLINASVRALNEYAAMLTNAAERVIERFAEGA